MADKNARRLFNDEQSPNPFQLIARSLRQNPDVRRTPPTHEYARTSPNAPSSHIVFFPWDKDSLQTRLWGGSLAAAGPAYQERWKRVAKDYKGVFAVANRRNVRVYKTTAKVPLAHLYTIVLDEMPSPYPQDESSPKKSAAVKPKSKRKRKNEHDDDVLALTWAMDPNELHPLLVIAAARVLHIFDTVRQCAHGVIKGHGGDITALATHPVHPQFVCSTSRDFTTRFYDLQRHARFAIPDPPRPPRGNDHFGGPPLGMQVRPAMVENLGELPANVEGFGYGKCIGVLWGPIAGAEHLADGQIQRTRVGGHSMAVFSADFHAGRNFIATCGLDHCVKIWRVPQLSTPDPDDMVYHRDQLPVFSSSAIHDSKVVSIRWIEYDLLLSESVHETVGDDHERHRFVIWKWLSIDRYADEDENGRLTEPNYRDVSDSLSYRIISIHDVVMPKHARPHLHARLGQPGSPLLFVPTHGALNVYNLKLFSPAPPPPFPHMAVDAREWLDARDTASAERLRETLRAQERRRFEPHPEPHAPWALEVADGERPLAEGGADLALGACAFSPDRRRVVAASLSGDVYVWDRQKDD